MPLEEILAPLELTVEDFVRVCDRFTNKKLFLTDARGDLVKDREGNLTKTNYDNPHGEDPTSPNERLDVLAAGG
jgi:hypothetical protein